MAPHRPLLLQLWVTGTLTLVLGVVTAALWWERQLPQRVLTASRDQDWAACLRASDQLNALRWLSDRVPAEQALCRRQQAAALWGGGNPDEALALQQQLVQSQQGTQADEQRLEAWRRDLREQALRLFQAGELEGALNQLAPLEQRQSGAGFSDALKEDWHRNRLEAKRLGMLVEEERWWEALDSHNRLDHPWWTSQTRTLRRTVDDAIRAMGENQDHLQHGSDQAGLISGAELNAAVQAQLDQGLAPWPAFEAGCGSLGGRVEEDGPESFCRRHPLEGS